MTSTVQICTAKTILFSQASLAVLAILLLRMPSSSSSSSSPSPSPAATDYSAAKPVLTFCAGQSPYFTSSPAVTQGELENFLEAVSGGATVAMHRSFIMSSDVSENRTLHAVAQCLPDVAVPHCTACLTASSGIIAGEMCAASAVWYDLCFLRYSDQNTSSFREDEYTARVYNASGGRIDHGKAMVTGLLAATVDTLVNKSSGAYTDGCVGRGAANSSAGQVYGLARCIPGLERADCGRCLRGALAVVEKHYNGSAGMQVLRLSCTARYESYRFINSDSPKQFHGFGAAPANIRFPFPAAGPARAMRGEQPLFLAPAPTKTRHKTKSSGALPPFPAPAPAQTRQRTKSRKIMRSLLIILSAIGAAIGANFVLFLWCHCKQRKNRRDAVAEENSRLYHRGVEENNSSVQEEEKEISISFQTYSYQALEVATCHFSNNNKLGSGGFGTVYRGTLENGKEIAVKKLKDSKRSLLELEREVSIVAKLQHQNIVRFLGYCFEGQGRLLVYEYLPNNSINNFWNHGSTECRKLDWATWFNVIKGVAHGLLFLHNQGIIHRDLKPHNVLLDENFNPKIADFDLVRVYNKDKTHESTEKFAGTLGYMAPECTKGRKSHPSIKSDVYSYGVLVLEIITGRKINTFEGQNSESLVEYVWQHWNAKKVSDVVDSDLDLASQELSEQHALRCVHIALLCVQSDRSRRPTMDQVIAMLTTHDMELHEPCLPGYLHPKTASGVLHSLPCFQCVLMS